MKVNEVETDPLWPVPRATRRGDPQRQTEPRKDGAPAKEAVRLLSTPQAAAYLGVSPSTVRDLFYKGHFRAIKVLRHLRFDVLELDAWIERQKEAAT